MTEQLDEHQYRRLLRASRITIMDGFTLGLGLFLFGVFVFVVSVGFSMALGAGGISGLIDAARRESARQESKPSLSEWLKPVEGKERR